MTGKIRSRTIYTGKAGQDNEQNKKDRKNRTGPGGQSLIMVRTETE
jgi:hypothetical protein